MGKVAFGDEEARSGSPGNCPASKHFALLTGVNY